MTLDELVKDIAGTVKESVQEAVKAVSEKYDARIAELEAQLKNLPAPEKGDKGNSVTIEDIKPLIEEAVSAIEVPVPENGKDGADGENGKDGADGKDGLNGSDGLDGKDGVDGVSPSPDEVAKSMEGIFAKWALDFERKADDKLEKAIDRMPRPKDGRDGLEIEDFELSLGEDGRTITAALKRGETVIEKSVKIPAILDKGVYSDAVSYEKGDGVTYAGSYWIVQKDSPEGKPGSSDDFRLAVKRGRDGKESVKVEKPKTVKVNV